MERLRPVGRKADLVRAGPKRLGGQFAGGLEQKRGPATGRIQSSWIGPAVTEGRDKCLSRDRVQRRPRRRVEVGRHDTTLASQPSTPHRCGALSPVRSRLTQEDLERGGRPVQRRRWVRVFSRASLSGAVLLLLTSCSTSDIEERIRWG